MSFVWETFQSVCELQGLFQMSFKRTSHQLWEQQFGAVSCLSSSVAEQQVSVACQPRWGTALQCSVLMEGVVSGI